MKIVYESFKDLRALYVNQLRTLLSAEEQMVRSLPDMANMAHDEQLQEAFWKHLHETEVHVKRMEELLANMKGIDHAVAHTGPVKCKAIHALIAEADDMMMDAREAHVKDAALIAGAQRIEHYEIAAYGALRHFARVLGEARAAEVLDETIKEEQQSDQRLSSIAERVNVDAKHAHHTAGVV
jgi:ferritin-like metal-binding protein YciE